MCYSGKCRFERHDGDCNFPSHIKSIKEKYGNHLCHPHLDGEAINTWYKSACGDVDKLEQEHYDLLKLKEEQSTNRYRLQKKLQKLKH